MSNDINPENKLRNGISTWLGKADEAAQQIAKGTLLAWLISAASVPILASGGGVELTGALAELVGSIGSNIIANRLETFFLNWRQQNGNDPNPEDMAPLIENEMETACRPRRVERVPAFLQ